MLHDNDNSDLLRQQQRHSPNLPSIHTKDSGKSCAFQETEQTVHKDAKDRKKSSVNHEIEEKPKDKRKSCLFQETGRIILQTVSDKNKIKTQTETDKLNAQLEAYKIKQRKIYADKYKAHCKRFEQRRLNQIELWRVKTASSPFRIDLNAIEHAREVKAADREKEERQVKATNELINSMTGKPENDICPKISVKKVLSLFDQIALERSLLVRDLNIVGKEQIQLNNIIEKETLKIEKKFPNVALMRAYGSTSSHDLDLKLKSPSLHDQAVSSPMRKKDNYVYEAAGKYDEWGNFILVENLKQSVMTAKYAQAPGEAAPVLGMRDFESKLQQDFGGILPYSPSSFDSGNMTLSPSPNPSPCTFSNSNSLHSGDNEVHSDRLPTASVAESGMKTSVHGDTGRRSPVRAVGAAATATAGSSVKALTNKK